MADTIFLHYTKEQLDHNYDQRAWAKNAEQVVARYASRSVEARRTIHFDRDIAYGPGPEERLDWFHADKPNAPVIIFIHGGAWRNFTKDDFSFVAPTFVANGCHVAILNFSKAPAVRLPAIVDQVRRGIAWVYHNLQGFDADRSRVFVSGHSSGAFVAALMLLTHWSRHGVTEQRIFRAAFCVSGYYDLEPVLLSARSSYLHMEGHEEHELSPIRHLHLADTDVMIAYCEGDTDEFQRHSREFADALAQRGLLLKSARLPGLNHFEIIETLAEPTSPLSTMILGHIARSL